MDASSIERVQLYRFDIFELDTLGHELRRQGVRIRLQERPYQVLLWLLQSAGKVVTRDELRHRLWPSVFVDFDHGLNNVVARLREALGDDFAEARFIETIPRVGYRFLPTVTALVDGVDVAAHPSPESVRWSRNGWIGVAAGVVAATVLAASLWVSLGDRRGTEKRAADVAASAPSIAVLPFANLSSDADDEGLSDGLTDEVITKLGAIRGLNVVARTSILRFKGKHESEGTMAQALHVDHFLEGTVLRSGARLRITAQLIDVRQDKHIWAQTFDRDVGDIFQIQEDIAFAIAAALKISLLDDDESRIRGRGTSDPEAYRLYLIGRAHLLGRVGGTGVPDMDVAKRSLDAAIQRDPNFAAAHAALARYYFRRAWGTLSDSDESARLGAAVAERAAALDPRSTDALLARADFEFWRYRFRGDYSAYVSAYADMNQAIELDPSNSAAFYAFGNAIIWHEPEHASSLLEHSIELDRLCTGNNIVIATVLGNRGQLEAARKRCADLNDRFLSRPACDMALGTLDSYLGHFQEAVTLLRASEKFIRGPARIELWSVYMSMGDRVGAQQWLDFGDSPFEKPLSDAARLAMDGRYEQAFTVLDEHRKQFLFSRLLDLPTAKFALIAGKPRQALEILRQRLPDLTSGIEPISARNLLPALDLTTALLRTGDSNRASTLLQRIAAYLDAPTALHLPMFTFQRARAYALAGDPDAALRALDRAYDEGLRTTWALDLRPQSSLYIDPIDVEPAFAALRDDPRFKHWLERIRADNAIQFERLSAPQVAKD